MTARVDPKALLEGITPGPWSVDCDKNTGSWCWQIRTVKPHNPAGTVGKHVADINRYLDPAPNARLIAAAPTLARELIEAREALERVGCQAPAFIQSTGGCDGECYVCAVLAKVAG